MNVVNVVNVLAITIFDLTAGTASAERLRYPHLRGLGWADCTFNARMRTEDLTTD